MVDKISPKDSRVQYKVANLNGINYSYILAEPQGQPIHTIFLIHGFPDISFSWRYQIPFLTTLGLRVVVPDMMGYAGTEAPESPKYYTFKRTSDDMAALAKHLGLSSIILGGHDWGGAVVYRVALRYPKLISAFFSICTPFMPPNREYVSMTTLPNFQYQKQLKGPDVEANIVGEEKLRQFLNGIYGGKTPTGQPTFTVAQGCLFENLPSVGPSPLLSLEEMDFYVKRFAINGMHGPLNWYRTGELNFEDEKEIAQQMEGYKFEMPVLFIAGTNDAALPPAMSKGMEKWFKSLSRGEVESSHWALWEKPEEINQYLKDFLVGKVGIHKANL